MELDDDLSRLAATYARQGYAITLRPGPEDMPPFAKDFVIEILGKRGEQGVLIAAKRDRDEIAADPNLIRYAEIIGAQPNWRFDLAALRAPRPNVREIDGAADFSAEDIEKSFSDSALMIGQGLFRPALITAWAAFEAAMRLRRRASGEPAGWGMGAGSMVTELYSDGLIDPLEYRRLEDLIHVRNQIAHGFQSTVRPESSLVEFLCELGRRLVEESRIVEVVT